MNLSEILQNCWRKTIKHINIWIPVCLIVFTIYITMAAMGALIPEEKQIQTIIFTIAQNLFGSGIMLGVYKISLDLELNNKPSFIEIFGSFHLLIKYCLISLCSLLVIIIAAIPGATVMMLSVFVLGWQAAPIILCSILILIPIIYASIRIQLAVYYLINSKSGVIESIILSTRATNGHVMSLLSLGLLIFIIMVISAILTLGLGLLVFIPLAWTINAHVYLLLKGAINE